MKFGTAYKSHLEDKEPRAEVKPDTSGEGLSKQLKVEWLASPVTEEQIKRITTEIEDHTTKAINLAKTFSEHQNHLRIVDALIRVDELNKQLEMYKQL